VSCLVAFTQKIALRLLGGHRSAINGKNGVKSKENWGVMGRSARNCSYCCVKYPGPGPEWGGSGWGWEGNKVKKSGFVGR